MRVLIVYDSFFGNTEKIALAIRDGLAAETVMINIRNYGGAFIDNDSPELIILGSPTRGFKPTPEILNFIKKLDLSGKLICAFDTRVDLNTIKSKTIRKLVHTGGYAAKKLNNRCMKKGGIQVLPPEGFLVTGEEGPLGNEELIRAEKWGGEIAAEVRKIYGNNKGIH